MRWRFRWYTFSDSTSEAERNEYRHYRTCWTNGTITVKGESYVFQVRWPDVFLTNFPDGKEKMLQSGVKGNDPPTHLRYKRPKPIHYPLPKDALIQQGKSSSTMAETDCSYFRFTAQAIRHRFRTYHQLVEGEFHDSFGEFPCRFEGSIAVQGRTYTFEAKEGNLLLTDFPDGVNKELGGLPSAPLDDTDPGAADTDVIPQPKEKRQ